MTTPAQEVDVTSLGTFLTRNFVGHLAGPKIYTGTGALYDYDLDLRGYQIRAAARDVNKYAGIRLYHDSSKAHFVLKGGRSGVHGTQAEHSGEAFRFVIQDDATPVINRTLEFHKKVNNTGVDAADWTKYMVLY